MDAPTPGSLRPPRHEPRTALARSPTLRGALVLALLVAAFLATPLARLPDAHFFAADITQNHSLTNLRPGNRSANELISDPVTEFVPWLVFNRAELAAGRVPLWNPYNGCGAPHLANYQSAVFSPFSLPFYVLGLKWALVLVAGLKLYLLGLLTYLFLLRLGLAHLPALLGGVTFAFSGNNVLLLSYPHSGVMVTLPAALLCLEVAFQRLERAPDPRRAPLFGPVFALGAVLALGLIAGHPEPYYFCAWIAAAYALFRLAHLALRAPRLRWRPLAAVSWRLALAALLAAGLGAWQVLPFLEYLQHSEMLELRSHRQTPLNATFWPLLLFPDLLGSPASPHVVRYDWPPPNYEAMNSVYVGGVAMLLGALAVPFLLRDRRLLFFGALAVVWPIYAYDVGGALDLFAHIPTLGIAPVNRSQGLWHFALACCGGLVADLALRARLERRKLLALLTAAAGALVLGPALARGLEGLPLAARSLGFPPELVAESRRHVAFIAATFVLGAAALSALWVAPARWRGALCALVLASVYLQSGFMLRDYNPVAEDELVYPQTPAMARLQELVGGDRLAIFGEDAIPPNTNLIYRVDVLANYDALNVRRFEDLHTLLMGARGNWRIATRANAQALEMFGVGWALSWADVPSASGLLARRAYAAASQELTPELLPDAALVQSFVALRDGLCAVVVRLEGRDLGRPCHLLLELYEAGNSSPLAVQVLPCAAIAHPLEERPRAVVSFAPVEDSAGRSYGLVVRSPDSAPGEAPRLWTSQGFAAARARLALLEGSAGALSPLHVAQLPPLLPWTGELSLGGAPLAGGLLLEPYYASDPFTPAARLGPQTLYRFERSSGKVHAVGRARTAPTQADARALTVDAGHDPAVEVVVGPQVLGGPLPPMQHSQGEPSPVVVLEELPGSWRVSAPRAEPGWLVFAQSFFPGWRARVDGVERPVVQANYAFTAVPLGVGENLVELVYDPLSFRLGLWIAAASAALAALCLLVHLRARRA